MSRETDSSSSGPQGRGGAAYPSGTPPYGSRQYPSLHPSEGGPGEAPEPADPPRPDEPRTETTLTTRIRINIPGSRPIPPVVMRTPMSDTDTSGGRPDTERTGSTPRPGTSADGESPAGDERGGQEPKARDGDAPAEKPAKEKSGSDWFAPRKPVAPGPAAPAAAGGGSGSGSGGGPGSGSGPAFGPGTGTGSGGGFGAGLSAGAGSASGGPAAGSGSGSASVPPRADLPFRPEGGTSGPDRSSLDAFGADGPGGPGAAASGGRGQAPSGPTTGPMTGSSSLTPDLDKLTGRTGGSGPAGSGGARPGGASGPGGPAGSGSVPPRLSDDTAILTPQVPAPGRGPAGNVSGDTLTSGIPVVPPESRSGFPGGPGDLGKRPGDGPGGPAGPAAAAPAPAPKPAPPAKKGRSKLVLLCVGVFVLFGIAYGAGLLMNHSEVPKGTTVLGADIGGGTKEEAVTKLEAAFGKRAQAPLTLSVDGKEQKLDPEKAGLTLNSQETVRGAAGSDYNPVSVIGSLFGGARPADPVIPVDEEKLGLALTELAGVSGSANDGTIRFEPNKAVPVPGRSGQALDVNRSMISVRDAYRAQVETGKPAVVELPVATTEPTIDQAELDRAMKEFAEPAMSGLITIKAGAKQIDFGPARSLPKILSMKPVDGRLVEVYDKKAIDTLLDGVFDGIMITKGDGQQHEVGADDVAHAMQTALLGKTPAERTVAIDLGGEG
ncbi:MULTISPECIES: hypothetical protein [unclassified Streptomyces]|uniref:hypothetical protein n=2 Tax=unclassified Streptomyces TaxID=2593676 RepID=UPI0003A94AED|nr:MULTISPECIES: hypothetical protein [unclassified Streptomyces]